MLRSFKAKELQKLAHQQTRSLVGGTSERRKRRLLADDKLLMLLRNVALDFALEDKVGLKEEEENKCNSLLVFDQKTQKSPIPNEMKLQPVI